MIEIRPLQKSDRKQLMKLLVDFLKYNQRGKIVSKKLSPLIRYKDYDKHLREDHAKIYMKLDSRKAAIFVAEDNKELIGYIYGRIVSKPKMILDKIGIVEDWFVEEKYSGKGIGEMLWNRLIDWFRKKGCNCLELDVYTTNKHAIEIYHGMGFIDKALVMRKKL